MTSPFLSRECILAMRASKSLSIVGFTPTASIGFPPLMNASSSGSLHGPQISCPARIFYRLFILSSEITLGAGILAKHL
jgi:hypothetical protein